MHDLSFDGYNFPEWVDSERGLINIMAERVGLINYRAVTSDMTTLNLDMQINTYMLAFINYIHILDYKRFEINLIH